MGAGTWYVDSTRAAVDWAAVVSSGAATVGIYRVVVDGSSHEQTYLWRKAGAPVTSSDVVAAQAETTSGPVPAPILPVSPVAPGGVPGSSGAGVADGSVTLAKLAVEVKTAFLRRVVASIAVNTTAPVTGSVDYLYVCTAPLTLTLPTAVGTAGWYTVKNASAGSVSVVPSGVERIGGAVSVGLSAGAAAKFGSDGTTWYML